MKLTFPITIFLAMCLCFAYGFWLGRKNPEVHDPAPITLETLPSQSEVQLMLVRLGAEIKVDGDIGTKTKREWDRLYGNKMAMELWPKGE